MALLKAHHCSMPSCRTASACITTLLARRAKVGAATPNRRPLGVAASNQSVQMLLLDISILLACHAIQHTTWATAFRQADLFFPLVEGAHILSLSVSVGLIL